MLKLNTRHSTLIVNILAAIVLTLIVNFSYIISMIVDERERDRGRDREAYRQEQQDRERYRPRFLGTLHLSPDGYGYLVAEDGLILPSEEVQQEMLERERERQLEHGEQMERQAENEDRWQRWRSDSVFVNQQTIFIFNLQDGDQILGLLNRPRGQGNPSLDRPLERNGEEIAPVIYDRPNRNEEFVVQLLFYFGLSLIALTIMTFRFDANNYTPKRYLIRSTATVIAAAIMYMFAPHTNWMTGNVMFGFQSNAPFMFDWMVVLKCIVLTIVAILYGRIYGMLLVQQKIMLENEHLRNENLQSRYNMLLGQISPHFFFNSLNSLSMLVREQDEEKTLAYIDQLSYTFRYIIQNGQAQKSTLAEELEFANAYGEIFKVRYADKFFFDIDIDKKYYNWVLPSLTLQPLIGNAVKHNTITRKQPLHIIIKTEGNMLVVANRKTPKLEPEPSTGIGLKNLRGRWQLIMGCDIEIKDTDTDFIVRMPLQKPVTD